jgi:DNA phosphorothioation-dependent restriction protein DptG
MESETVSKNRDGYLRGWIHLEKRLGFIFAHANCLELLNYIKLDGQPIGNYQEIKSKYDALDEIQKVDLIHNINELERHYTDFIKELKISKLESYWDKYYKQLENDHKFQSISSPIEKVIYKFWFNINYQFLNTKRNKPYKDYSLWFIEFCKANFLKRRGRIGYTLKMDQEHLLFLTKLCIGVQPKIRLKTLWARLKMRGVNFDESSKMEIIKLFEKINLIDKKSDSGDAQYVRTIL